jgi:hypothetical protein
MKMKWHPITPEHPYPDVLTQLLQYCEAIHKLHMERWNIPNP